MCLQLQNPHHGHFSKMWLVYIHFAILLIFSLSPPSKPIWSSVFILKTNKQNKKPHKQTTQKPQKNPTPPFEIVVDNWRRKNLLI